MKHKTNFSILINTTDSFEDCWEPFFRLFSRYWPEYNGKIFLNTETKSFSYAGLEIISIKNNSVTPLKKATWSECLIRALKKIDCDVILYMQEDYFIKEKVKHELVEKYAKLIIENRDIHCIHLTDQAVMADQKPANFEGLCRVIPKQRYLVSCQAAFWRKDILLSYLRPYENAWQFEEFGSRRGEILKHNFYVVDKSLVKLNEFEIIPYIFTGIIQGKWYEKVIPLFKKDEISVDYSKRGFFNQTTKKSLVKKLLYRWNRAQVLIINAKDIWKLKHI